jgi:hypothetical protein
VESIKAASADRTVQTGNRSRFMPGDWRAAAWLLERTNPEWAAPSRVEVSGPGGAPLQIQEDIEHRLAMPDPERLQRVVGLLARAGAIPQLEMKEEANGNGNGHAE